MLIKTKSDHRKVRALITENTKALTLSPAAGALTAGEEDEAYSVSISVSNDPVGSVRFDITSGALPTGLSLNAATGAITGTPTEVVAAKAVTIRATDEFGNTGSAAYTITIAAAGG